MSDPTTLFITYDRGLTGEVSALRKELERQLRLDLVDRSLRIVQDIDILATGDDWKKRLDESLEKASILIVIVTTSLLDSEECKREILFFDRKISNGARAAIAPVLMREAAEIYRADDPDQRPDLSHAQKLVIKALRRNNYFDGLIFFRQSPDSSSYKARVEELAKDLKKKILGFTDTSAAPEPPPQPLQSSTDVVASLPTPSDDAPAANLRRAPAVVPEPRRFPIRINRWSMAVFAAASILAGSVAFVKVQSWSRRVAIEAQTPSISWKDAGFDAYLLNEGSITLGAIGDPTTPDVVVDQIQPGARRPLASTEGARLSIGSIEDQTVWYRYTALNGKPAFIRAHAIVLKRK